MKRTRKNTSIVWDFFTKSADNSSVKCRLCKKNLKFFNNTTALNAHLKRLHTIQLKESNGCSESEPDIFKTKLVLIDNNRTEALPGTSSEGCARKKTSIVWNYFTKSEEDSTVECRLCKKELKSFKNTTNLKEHLKRVHPIQLKESEYPHNYAPAVETELMEYDPLASSESEYDALQSSLGTTQVEPLPNTCTELPSTTTALSPTTNSNLPRKNRSVVWDFFKKSTDNYAVKCRLCKGKMKFFGNTTNLKEHLKRRHPIPLKESEGHPRWKLEVREPDTSSTGATRKNMSIVWEFFTKSADNSSVKCRLCEIKMKFYKNTTNLRNHLERLHPVQLKVSESRPYCESAVIANELIEYDPFPSRSGTVQFDEHHSSPCPSGTFQIEAVSDTSCTESIQSTNSTPDQSAVTTQNYFTEENILSDFLQKSSDDSNTKCGLRTRKLKFLKNTTKRVNPIQLKEIKDHSYCEPVVMEYVLTKPDPGLSRTASAELLPITSSTGFSKSTGTISTYINPERKTAVVKDTITEDEQIELDKAVIEMIVSDYQPLSFVENKGFLEYTYKLQPLYKPPSRKHLSNVLIPRLYSQTVSKLKDDLGALENAAITTEIWTCDSNKSYITVTCHFILEDSLQTKVLSTREIIEPHTDKNIAQVLKDILIDWNILNQVFTIVTVNDSNIEGAVNEYLQKHHQPCLAHTLYLSVTEAISSHEILQNILRKCRTIVGHFNQSIVATEELKRTQEQMNLPVLKVKKEVKARWNSMLIMIERLLKIKVSLSLTLSNLSQQPEALDDEDWIILNDCVMVLKPIEHATTILSAEKYPTISLVIPIVRGLQHSLKNMIPISEGGQLFRRNLIEIVSRRFLNFETNQIAAMATMLDPRFKNVAFGIKKNSSNAQKWIIDEIVAMDRSQGVVSSATVPPEDETEQTTSENKSIWDYFDSKASQHKSTSVSVDITATNLLRQYIEMPLLERTQDPLIYWKSHKNIFPNLYKLAMKYLCSPSTSVSSETLFSKSGQLRNERRKRLDEKNLNQIIFLSNEI